MLRSIVAASAAVVALSAGAIAQDSTISLGVERADFDGVSLDSVAFRGAHFFNETFGIEGQLNIGVGDDTVRFLGTDVDVSQNWGAGVFAVARTGGEGFNLLGRLGYVHADIEADVAGFSASEDDGALAAGVAAEWYLDGRNGVRLDYTYADYDDSVSIFGISYVRRLGG